jgi:electron transfer flavoprotein alpha/beta subunit
MQSKNKEIKQMAIADLKLDESIGGRALTQEVESIAPAESRKAGRIIEDKGEAAREIVDFLAGLKVI